MYYFNSLLFEKLPSLLKVTMGTISESVYGNIYNYKRRIENQENIEFEELVRLCNAFRISMARFVTTNAEEPYFENRFKYVIPEDRFKPILFRPENIRMVYGKNGLGKGIIRDIFAKALGISVTTVTRWINPNIGGTTVHKLIEICNRYGIDLDVFVEDKNEPLPKFTGKSFSDHDTPRIWQEIDELKQTVDHYREENRKLTEENRNLRISIREQGQLAEPEMPEYQGEAQSIRKWTVNWPLLENLYLVLGVSRQELIRAAGMVNFNSSYFHGNLLVSSFVKLCNHYQVSTHHFFQRGNPAGPELHPYSYYKSEEWIHVEYNPENINYLFGPDSVTGMTRVRIEKICGLNRYKIRSWRGESSQMRIKDMIDLCNKLNITPSFFITDLNRPELEYHLTPAEILLEENRMLRMKILRQEEELRLLKPLPSTDK